MNNNQKETKRQLGNVYFDGSSWCHSSKILQKNGSIKYEEVTGFKTEQEAKDNYNKLSKQFEKQRKNYWASHFNKDMMFKPYIEYWYENIYSPRIESTTQMLGAYIVYNLILPNVQYDIKLKQVTCAYLDELLEIISKVTKTAGFESRLILNMAFKDAVINGLIPSNPVKNVKKYKREKPKVNVLNKEETRKLLEKAQDTNWYLEILLGLFCGLRKGEILALKEEDFNINNQTVTIKRQLANQYKIKEGSSKIKVHKIIEKLPKTENSIRTIKIPRVIIDELSKRISENAENKKKYKNKYIDKHYISCTKYGKNHGMTSLNKCLNDICDKCSLRRITVHSLRHMFATILSEQGVPLVQISALLGHESIHTTYQYYIEMTDERNEIANFMNYTYKVDE